MTRMVLTLILGFIAGFSVPVTLSADVLLIEEVRQAGRMDVPANGMNTAEVRARFGEPVNVHATVGDPPITRWEYDRWSVYFEYDLVLFTVLHKGAVIDKKTE
ncbi:MAG: hypothetical protein HKN57_02330 [Xanthomonadales bacterium]|nr:hypothetical protein [Gammaproteobacteria bacterium]MBT8053709.1 hypothetical protein [Gammaproteobacteria bacterium]NND56064.1 hypothetical protein [Xanthomonadales bacterium]NNK50195.1 hypothetical protein [Xanthomonadales bacterium]